MNYLDKIDKYYYSKKTSEVWMMTILVAVLVGYLIYTLLNDSSEKYKKRQISINKKLKSKISKEESYLRSITVNGDRNFYIKDLDKKILAKKAEVDKYREKLRKIANAMVELKDLVYTKDNWSKFLHDLTKKAEKNSLEIYTITNKNYEQNATFGKVLDVNIKAKGKYGDILSFMNAIEQTKLVTNITNVKLSSSKSKPVVDINMSVWSIRP